MGAFFLQRAQPPRFTTRRGGQPSVAGARYATKSASCSRRLLGNKTILSGTFQSAKTLSSGAPDRGRAEKPLQIGRMAVASILVDNDSAKQRALKQAGQGRDSPSERSAGTGSPAAILLEQIQGDGASAPHRPRPGGNGHRLRPPARCPADFLQGLPPPRFLSLARSRLRNG